MNLPATISSSKYKVIEVNRITVKKLKWENVSNAPDPKNKCLEIFVDKSI